MSTEDDGAAMLALFRGEQQPDVVAFASGWAAHAQGTPYQAGPQPMNTVRAVCWRVGWSTRAMQRPDKIQ
jgi:hypothetical protein